MTAIKDVQAHLRRNPITQMKRYEAGTSQPTLEVIRKLSQVLRVSADELLFGKTERGPDEDRRLQFEAISRFNEDEKKVVRSVLEGLLLTREARPWSSGAAVASKENFGWSEALCDAFDDYAVRLSCGLGREVRASAIWERHFEKVPDIAFFIGVHGATQPDARTGGEPFRRAHSSVFTRELPNVVLDHESSVR